MTCLISGPAEIDAYGHGRTNSQLFGGLHVIDCTDTAE